MSTYLGTNRGRGRLSLGRLSGERVIDPNTVLLCSFENAIEDDMGRHTLTAAGDAVRSTSGPKYGVGCLALGGNGDYLTAPDSKDFEFLDNDFTIEAWIYPGGAGTYRAITAKSSRNDGSGAGSFVVQINDSNKLYCGASDVTTGFSVSIIGSTDVVAGQWHHVAFTRSGSVFTIWLNGQSQGTASSSLTLLNNAQVLTIGCIGYTGGSFVSYFNGKIDDLRISKICRYTASFYPPAVRKYLW